MWLEQYELRHRRLVAQPVGLLGTTPLTDVALPFGSYRLRLRAPGREQVLYPEPQGPPGTCDRTPPQTGDPQPVWLPPAGTLGPA